VTVRTSVRELVGWSPPRYKRVWNPRPYPFRPASTSIGTEFGYALAGVLTAAPHKLDMSDSMGDHLPGSSLEEVLESGKKLKYYESYAWCGDSDDVIDTIVRRGPVLLSLPWYASMCEPRPDGIIPVNGVDPVSLPIMANGYWPMHPDFGDIVILTDSCDYDWGSHGRVFLRVPDLKRLMDEGGEGVIPHMVAPRIPIYDEED
jgi:hypothetical protein